MKRTKEQNGITLIALIITIVVLMILAAVAINSITNEGILSQAGSTANQYNQAVKDEESYLQDYEDMLTAANGGYKDKNFKVGDEVTVGTEPFYVIEDKTSLGKVVLLAKECIDPTTLTQGSRENKIAFSTTNYWADDFTSDPYDLTETGVPDESHYAARAAYDYGLKVGGKGRLMTYKECKGIEKLGESDIYAMLYGFGNFWLSAAHDTDNVWEMEGNNAGYNWGNTNYVSGVRPVVEISKSKVTKVQ